MSFGDPNNPYGQQQGGQPGYGYPQQSPQGGQPGYGYPQAPAGYGYPGGPTEMPGGVKAARIMLYILGGFQALGAVLAIVAGAWISKQLSDTSTYGSDSDKAAGIGMGVMVVVGIFILAFALWAILTAAKFTTGGNGIRISAIVYGSVTTLFSLISLLGANVFSLISIALGIMIIVFCAKQDGAAWFQRPRP
ncbi:hypothetical protein ACF1BU_02175 [Streptomyces sp. NPDC014724]|uniref:hypothetical protein n=1 Tax=unclassified Streptomyces TaxID=2593676 RepID=UPI0036F846B2